MNPHRRDSAIKMIADSISVKQSVLADEALLDNLLKVVEVAESTLRNGNKIIFAGNGGSAADAQHLAAEIVSRFEFDRPGLAATALNTDTSILTAIGNDYGYDYVFARQIEANGNPGDLFVGISTSGNSKNILMAAEASKKKGLVTVALCGAGGKLRELCDHQLSVPSTSTPRIQECHILIGHILCSMVETGIWGASHAPDGASD